MLAVIMMLQAPVVWKTRRLLISLPKVNPSSLFRSNLASKVKV